MKKDKNSETLSTNYRLLGMALESDTSEADKDILIQSCRLMINKI